MIATSVESRVDTIFLRASELRGDERDSYLTDLCGIDRALRARVDQLLRESDRLSGDSDVLRTTMLRQKAGLTLLATKSETLPIALERYDLEARLGEGAFGVVYRAIQHTPVRRAVAIKVVRPGLDGPQIVRRFEAERQALATLDHANVARLFDAGNMPDGRPFFVMELLDAALPFTKYCERNDLDLRSQLELFLEACAAVEHAHSRAILHRDLKPSNILVIERNGRGTVKVIDFGIARALAPQPSSGSAAAALATEIGAPVGTPEYMCPEQASGEHERVDTRSDVYALGVVLYELICGQLPFTSDALRNVSPAEMRRIICEVEPPRPSAVKRSRDAEELEWIPLRALKKDPDERYRSVAELADDVRSYLGGRPLLAGPDSRAYRARKWIARHRRALAIAGAIGIVALGVAVQYVRGIHAEQQRRTEALAEAQQQRDEAGRQRRSADAVNRFLAEMLGAADPSVSRGDALKVVDVLDRSANEVGTRFAEQPDVQMSLHRVIGETYFSLGMPDRALQQFDAGMGIANRSGGQLPDVIDALNAGRVRAILALGKPRDAVNAADARVRGFATECATAEALLAAGRFNDALVQFQSLQARVPANLPPAARIALTLNYARSVLAAGRQYDALPLLEQTAQVAHSQLTADHPQTIETDAELAGLLATVGEFKRAEPLLRDTLTRGQKILGQDHPTTISVTAALASLLQMTGRFDESTSLVQQCIDHHSSRFGPDHPDAIAYEAMRAGLLQTLAKYDEAKTLLQDVIDRRRRVLGEDHPNTIDSESALGWLLSQAGDRAAAEVQMRQVVPKARRVFGDDHPATLGAINNLALSLEPETNLDEAEALYKEVIERAPHLMKWDAPQISGIYNNYGNLLKGRGRPEETLALQEKSLEARARLFGEDSLDAAQSHNNVALALMDMSRFAEAEVHVKRSWELNRKWLGEDHPSTLNSLNTYALVVDELHRIGEAEQFHRQILDARRRTMGLDHNLTVQSEINLASVLFRQKRPSESVPLFRHAYDVYEKEFGDDSPHTKMVAYRLAVCLERSGNTSEGEMIRRKHHIEPDPPPPTKSPTTKRA